MAPRWFGPEGRATEREPPPPPSSLLLPLPVSLLYTHSLERLTSHLTCANLRTKSLRVACAALPFGVGVGPAFGVTRARQGGSWPRRATPRRAGTGTGRRRCRPPPPRTKWTRRVPHPVLIGHAASLTPYGAAPPSRSSDASPNRPAAPAPGQAYAGSNPRPPPLNGHPPPAPTRARTSARNFTTRARQVRPGDAPPDFRDPRGRPVALLKRLGLNELLDKCNPPSLPPYSRDIGRGNSREGGGGGATHAARLPVQ